MALCKNIRINVRTRLLSVFLLSVLLPMILFGILMFFSSNKELLKESIKTYTQMTNQVGSVFSEYISGVDQTVRSIDNTNDIPHYLRDETLSLGTNNEKTIFLENSALQALKQYCEANSEIYSLSVITLNGKMLSYVDRKFDRPLYDFSDTYYAELCESTGNTVLLPIRNTQYLFSPPNQVFTVGFKFIDIATTEGDIGISDYTGYIIAECPISKLSEFCNNVDMGPGSNLYILNHQGQLFYSNGRNKEKQAKIIDIYNNGIMQGKVKINKEEYVMVSSRFINNNWTILATIPYKNLTVQTKNLQNTFLILCLLSMLIIIIVTFMISGNFTNPIRVLQKSMKMVGSGDLSVRIKHNRKDEFGELNDGFNMLIRELNTLIHDIAESEERENAAKYQMLQSQINPHFLYNTLDTIRMMAVLEDKKDIANALLHLSSLFRYHIRDTEKLVTIKEELLYAKNYLALQKLRFQDQIEIDFRIDNNVLSYKMPKIILQPLLENALQHGFYNLDRVGVLNINIKKIENHICFEVYDNGRGIPAEKLQFLHTHLSDKIREPQNGIGLINVNERLRLYFSKSSCLNIKSAIDKGTSISFSIPLINCDSVLYKYNHQLDENARMEDAGSDQK